jgi:hypothetical protein
MHVCKSTKPRHMTQPFSRAAFMRAGQSYHCSRSAFRRQRKSFVLDVARSVTSSIIYERFFGCLLISCCGLSLSSALTNMPGTVTSWRRMPRRSRQTTRIGCNGSPLGILPLLRSTPRGCEAKPVVRGRCLDSGGGWNISCAPYTAA